VQEWETSLFAGNADDHIRVGFEKKPTNNLENTPVFFPSQEAIFRHKRQASDLRSNISLNIIIILSFIVKISQMP